MIPILRLVRLPNVFTALADIIAGYFIATYGTSPQWGTFALLCGASAALYLSGMALNDYADRDEDARVRPERPIPSGAVTPRAALGVGLALMLSGVVLAAIAGRASLLCAIVVAIAVAGYDFLAKGRTLAGPLALGVCRFANMLLGMSAAYNAPHALDVLTTTRPWEMPWLPALASGLYGAGVTAFSAQEEEGKNRFALILGWVFCVLGLIAAVRIFYIGPPEYGYSKTGFIPIAVLYAQLVLATLNLIRTGSPGAARSLVLAGVKGYCLLDAGMLLLFSQQLWVPALAACVMLFPGGWLRKWLAQREA